MFYRGPSSRLETLIEKIQQTKEGMCLTFNNEKYNIIKLCD